MKYIFLIAMLFVIHGQAFAEENCSETVDGLQVDANLMKMKNLLGHSYASNSTPHDYVILRASNEGKILLNLYYLDGRGLAHANTDVGVKVCTSGGQFTVHAFIYSEPLVLHSNGFELMGTTYKRASGMPDDLKDKFPGVK